MKYGYFAPPEPLKKYVRYFWRLEDSGHAPVPPTFRTIADGCPGIIFQHGEHGSFFRAGKQLPPLFLYGQATGFAEIAVRGSFCTVGAYLFPHAIRSLFGIDSSELTDNCVDLNLPEYREQHRGLKGLESVSRGDDQFNWLGAFLQLKAERSLLKHDLQIDRAVQLIMSQKGQVAVKTLQNELGMSERRFKQYVGISPKLFARISRFQAALKQLRDEKYERLSDIAYSHEYADQSHFIRSFKEFSGVLPKDFIRSLKTSANHLPEIIF
ncbi:helix-turn-helix domain-containing protein [Pedobacter sp. SYP-B3415]|uniref:helix-turn-helix domain-containing protein n=1 Tax=Pedobacter sp. SYP-B3415 TaxID=2496641 RepID=UPI00101D18C4|nr:helix-turn-helix domain-containing protein [Pedobacter sp. SYP-B3415]